MKRIFITLTVIVLLISVPGCAFMPKEDEAPEAPIIDTYEVQEYRYVTVVRGDIISSTMVTATNQPVRTESCAFGVSDVELRGVYVELGQEVEEGTLLAELDCENEKTQLEAKEYELSLQRIELDYQYDLYTNELGRLQGKLALTADEGERASITAEIQSINSGYENTRSSINERITSLSYDIADLEDAIADRQIYAGISGTVTSIESRELTYKSIEKEEFITIEDQSKLYFATSKLDAAKVEPGQKVTIYNITTPYPGTVVDPEEHGLNPEYAYILADEEIPGIGADSFVRIERIDDERKDVLYITTEAVYKDNNGDSYVYVFDENGMKEVREVEVGLVGGRKAEILSGLSEGEKVILD